MFQPLIEVFHRGQGFYIDVQKRRKLSIPSHSPMGHSMGCPPVPLQMRVCPTVHPIPWSHRTVGLSIASHSPMEQWDIPWDVHLSLYRCVCVPLSILSHGPIGQWDCPSHPTVPWNSGTFHGMSTCPFTDACVSHCPSHPMVPYDSGTFHGMSTCPSYRYSHCSFHSTIP